MTVYTICSYSNLNQAIVLFHSIKQHATNNFSFFCFVIDPIPDGFFFQAESFNLIHSHELEKMVPDYNQLKQKYNAFELCCALKPFCGETLFSQSDDNQILIYLDSDILFYDDINIIALELGSEDILLTPHFTSKPPDFNKISELDIHNTGLYNGGFLAFKRTPNTTEFLKWWQERMKLFCFTDFEKGMFVDQLWLNFVPLYFNKVSLSKHKGLNVAYWNFHERAITEKENSWKVNMDFPLVFVHYSGFRLYRKDLISIHQTRYTFNDLPAIKELFLNYANVLETNALLYHLQVPIRTQKQRLVSKIKSVLQNPFFKK